MTRKVAVTVGFIGKLPYAGMSVYNLHHILALQDLGYRVHYVERQNTPNECYNPITDAMTDDCSYAIDYLQRELLRVGMGPKEFSFIDKADRCHGSGWQALRERLDQADFVLTLATPTWFDELERCSRRGFVDGDPLFTQVAMLDSKDPVDQAPGHYTALFTYAARMGMPDCTVPAARRAWIPTRPVVATKLWGSAAAATNMLPITCLMHWRAGPEVTYNGLVYGHKNVEFERFMDLPYRSTQTFALAVGGGAPKEVLKQHGWQLVDPLAVTGTLQAYQDFIAGSRADLGIAKHAYVASRCGWFSDRSTCFLAAGRPVLHQDTGFTDWLPAGEGVLAFRDIEGALDSLQCLNADYEKHARAARRLAQEYFEASTVVGRMLDDAGFR